MCIMCVRGDYVCVYVHICVCVCVCVYMHICVCGHVGVSMCSTARYEDLKWLTTINVRCGRFINLMNCGEHGKLHGESGTVPSLPRHSTPTTDKLPQMTQHTTRGMAQ